MRYVFLALALAGCKQPEYHCRDAEEDVGVCIEFCHEAAVYEDNLRAADHCVDECWETVREECPIYC